MPDGEPAWARDHLRTFIARAHAVPGFSQLVAAARGAGVTGVRLSAELPAKAATVVDPDGVWQTIWINPVYQMAGDAGAVDDSPVRRSWLTGSLLMELANAARRDDYAEIDGRAETGLLDEQARDLAVGPGEEALLARGSEPVRVAYAVGMLGVEHQALRVAAGVATALVQAGVLPQDDRDTADLQEMAALTPAGFIAEMVHREHADRYLAQFDQYLDDADARTPDSDDLRPSPE